MKMINRQIINRTGLTLVMLSLASLAGCATPAPSATPPLADRESFNSPEQATDALTDAYRRDDKSALMKILGTHGANIISSGDAVADKEGRDRFVSAYDQAHAFEKSDDGSEVLLIGDEHWPMPIPVINVADGTNTSGVWQFDTETGEQEILDRRIGRNEINAIGICHAYVEAQREYATHAFSSMGHLEYAQHFVSHPGKHDGLYWPASADEEESPFGPLIAEARAEGYMPGHKHGHYKPHPYHGYFFKILTEQGPDAPGGKHNYVMHGHMTGGFAMIAFPATYGDSGIMTFIVDQNGIVFQKNLGPDTAKLAHSIKQYDPDNSWDIVRE